jgi:diadenosine tetraphosphatase ApaH/serine/threonine PP2A family protein phosphatase
MRALLYDIHGNLPALEAVVADARSAGAGEFALGGDYALFGAFPLESVARLRELDAIWIRGNTDRWLEDPSDTPGGDLIERSLAHCREALAGVAQELASLPPTALVDGALICHASPRSDMRSFMPAASETDAELLAEDDPDVIVFGHTHLQFRRPSGRHTLVNPGSVGLPFDGDRRAAYALWHGGGDFELRRVEYDSDAYAAEVRERMGGVLGNAVDTLVERLRRAAFVS